MIAVLCCHRKSIYHEISGLDCYDIKRDVRSFAGGMPVIAHPPCRSWSAFCRHQAKPMLGEKELAPLCVTWLKKCGGVLEHPAHSTLWNHCKLPKPGEPPRANMFSLAVKQSWFGHPVEKETWLLFSKIDFADVPEIPYVLRYTKGDKRTWQVMSKQQRAATTKDFAMWLIAAASKVKPTTPTLFK